MRLLTHWPNGSNLQKRKLSDLQILKHWLNDLSLQKLKLSDLR